jgi:hypothetical protein
MTSITDALIGTAEGIEGPAIGVNFPTRFQLLG